MASDSCCWQLVAHRGGRAALGQRRGGVARSEENQRGGARAVAGLETTRGCYQSRKWHRQSGSDSERWRPAAAERGGSSGRRQSDVECSGKASREGLRRWASTGAARGAALEQG
jgi:hypothetical protein